MPVNATTAAKYIDEKRSLLTKLSDDIWEYAEVGLHEHRSAKALADTLDAEGFTVERGVAGMPRLWVPGARDTRIGSLASTTPCGSLQAATPVKQEPNRRGWTRLRT